MLNIKKTSYLVFLINSGYFLLALTSSIPNVYVKRSRLPLKKSFVVSSDILDAKAPKPIPIQINVIYIILLIFTIEIPPFSKCMGYYTHFFLFVKFFRKKTAIAVFTLFVLFLVVQ